MFPPVTPIGALLSGPERSQIPRVIFDLSGLHQNPRSPWLSSAQQPATLSGPVSRQPLGLPCQPSESTDLVSGQFLLHRFCCLAACFIQEWKIPTCCSISVVQNIFLFFFFFSSFLAPESLMQALEDLDYLAALDNDGNLSEFGIIMSEFPLDPQLSKSILASCEFDCVDEMLTIAAMVTGIP